MSAKSIRKIILLSTLALLSLSLFSCNEPSECSHKNFISESFAPTCDTAGYTLYSCDSCDYEYKSDTVSPLGHTLTSSRTEPTCNTEGFTTYSCECGYSYISDYVKPAAHVLSTSVIPPSCTKSGYTKNACAMCDYSFISDATAPAPHKLASTITAPKCEEMGFTTFSCEDCGYSYIGEFTEPTGHTLTSTVTAPTCEESGFTSYACKACDHAYLADHTKPTGHALTSTITAPTCEEQGFTTHSCEACEFSFVSDYTNPTGHAFEKTFLHATSTSLGFSNYRCECEYEYTEYIMPTDVFTGAYAKSDIPLAKGLDVSKWNGDIDWAAIKAEGFDFVIIKAGSIVGKDDKFEENYAGAKAAGLDVGAYFYSYAKSLEEIDEEADLFLAWLDGKQFEYPVYLDIEDPSLETLGQRLLTDMSARFIEKLQMEGYFCGIYINNNWLFKLLETERITAYFDVWYARYKIDNIEEWNDSWGDKLAMWQFTSTGQIGDHECNFDLNLVYKDYPTIIKEWGYNGFAV